MNDSLSSNPRTVSQSKKHLPVSFEIAQCTTNGGRSLNAIWYLDVSPIQKLILQFFGSELDFRGTFNERVTVSRKVVAAFVGICLNALDKNLKQLVEAGYLESIQHADKYECKKASSYALTPKLFTDYAQTLAELQSERGITPQAANLKRLIKGPIENREYNSNEGGTPRDGVGVPHEMGVFSPNSSPSSFSQTSDSHSENKTEEPCHSGGVDLIRTTITPKSPEPEIPPPLVNEGSIISWVNEMSFAYKRGKNENYDFPIANKAAETFIRERGPAACAILLSWARGYESFKNKCVKVNLLMYERLWAAFEADEKTNE